MCGIIGFSSNDKCHFDENKLSLLMIWNFKERGGDATGIFSPSSGLIKTADKASDFLKKTPLRTIEDSIFIGHVRAATSGDKALAENAHPFEYENLVGAHNGTVSSAFKLFLDEGYKASAEYNVDSKIIYKLINDKGTDIIKKIDGALSLVWYDKNTKDIKVYRNKERELYYGKFYSTVNDQKSIYISSIKDSLEIIGCTDIKEFEPEYLYTIKDGEIDDITINIPRFKEPSVFEKFSKYINCWGRFKKYSTGNGYTTPTFANQYLAATSSTFEYDYSLNNLTSFNFFRLLGFEKGTTTNYAKIELYYQGKNLGVKYINLSFLEEDHFINKKTYNTSFSGAICLNSLTNKKEEEILSLFDFTNFTEYEKDGTIVFTSHDKIKNETVQYSILDKSNFLPIFNADDLSEFYENFDSSLFTVNNNEETMYQYISFETSSFNILKREILKKFGEFGLKVFYIRNKVDADKLQDKVSIEISELFDEFELTAVYDDAIEEQEEVVESENLTT